MNTLEAIGQLDKLYDPETHLAGTAFTSAEYAALLFQRGGEADVERAVKVVDAMFDLQVDDPSARTHGQFPMREGGKVGDLNAALFIMPRLIELLDCGCERMPEHTASRLDACVRRAIVAAERRWSEERFDLHRDFKGYTNVFLLYTQALLLAGNHYNDGRLIRQAAAQWQRWFSHVSYYGIDEFASPAYNDVDYEALKRIHEQTRDKQMRRESGYVLDHLSKLLHALTHPVLRLLVSGSSRNYRRFIAHDNCEPQCVREGAESPYTSESVRRDYLSRCFPYSVQGRATTIPFRYQSWQDAHAALGSMTGGNYFWQQIHCMAAVGENETERAVMFIPGAYTPTSGFVCQREHTALCLFTRQPNTFHRTQSPMADADVQKFQGDFGIGMTSNWTVSEQDRTRIVLSAYGHKVCIQPFAISDGQVNAVSMPLVRQHDLGQGRFHKGASDFDALKFPEEAVWFGCLVSVNKTRTPALSSISCSEKDSILNVSTESGLRVSVFRHESGDVTELYEDDWRTRPLLESPVQTLRPGELTHLAANAEE